ncbi:NAD(+)/NADH kinase [Solimonas marina]|uniref:NAD kinase n=1 Tax=Solimonas marina TaxID=2714601 RepID=A0A969WA40_9GAMM|nr:NAD(+)/NADH kinase [Solimonas marina]NKF23157.1 hypothetical protein [Solimonas marina]
MPTFSTVGIIGKRRDPNAVPTLLELLDILRTLGREVCVEDMTLSGAELPAGVPRLPRAELARRCDLAVVVGGDGTLLSAARDLAPAGVALVGVNQGRLGFMVDVPPADMRETLAAIFAGEYVREDRLMLQATLLREKRPQTFLAMNDVVIRNQAAIRMLEFESWLDDEFISQHRADGFIVASPTGSTAYALSGGGPVVHPGLDALTLVPICPHTLSDRPIVINSRQRVRITLRGAPNTVAMLTGDGQTAETLHAGESVEVSAAPFRLQLVHPRHYSYFNILRNKLHWGRGPASSDRLENT